MNKKRYKGPQGMRKEVMIMRCQGTSTMKEQSEDMKEDVGSWNELDIIVDTGRYCLSISSELKNLIPQRMGVLTVC